MDIEAALVELEVRFAARVHCGDAPSYSAAITSVYRRADGGWELVLHQQTPLSANAD